MFAHPVPPEPLATDRLDRPAVIELVALVGTAGAHLATWQWPVVHAALVATLVLGWTAFFAIRARREPGLRRELGITRQGLGSTLRLTLPLAGAAVVVFALIGHARGSLSVPWTLGLLALSYPLWGLTQQLMVQGVLVRRLSSLSFFERRPWAIALAAGLLFGAVHWPFPALMVGTSLMGAVFALIYLKHRNLWPLGVLHGWVGALFFLWVMGKDPMMEFLVGMGV